MSKLFCPFLRRLLHRYARKFQIMPESYAALLVCFYADMIILLFKTPACQSIAHIVCRSGDTAGLMLCCDHDSIFQQVWLPTPHCMPPTYHTLCFCFMLQHPLPATTLIPLFTLALPSRRLWERSSYYSYIYSCRLTSIM